MAWNRNNFHHHCFAREVDYSTDHKPPTAIFKKMLQHYYNGYNVLLLRIHHYRICMLYKPDLDQFIADWLSRQNHTENNNKEIAGMKLSIDTNNTTTDIPTCISIKDIQEPTQNDDHRQ